MITNRNDALIAGIAYRDTFRVWTVWDETHAYRVFDDHLRQTSAVMAFNPPYVVHLYREFQLAAFSGDTRLIAPERTLTIKDIARLLCMSYETVRSAKGLIVIEGRVSAADFVTYANKQMNRQEVLI